MGVAHAALRFRTVETIPSRRQDDNKSALYQHFISLPDAVLRLGVERIAYVGNPSEMKIVWRRNWT